MSAKLDSSSSSSPLVVGIGASAGGLQAIEDILTSLAGHLPFAVVIVQHLNSVGEQILTEMLAGKYQLPVRQIDDATEIVAGTVYIAPAESGIELVQSQLVRVELLKEQQHAPIDHFFASLAAARKEFAVGVVLSGGGTDGTLGLKAISNAGGMTVVQSAETAAHPSMPESAASLGLVDFVLPSQQIADELLRHAEHLGHYHNDQDESQLNRQIITAIGDIAAIIKEQTDNDFKHYKTTTLARRIRRRLHVLKLTSVEAYLDILRSSREEVFRLFRDLLISVTEFFRDPEAFESLANNVLPQLLADRANGDALRVWVAGCATGEEAYSIAILIREAMDTLPDPVDVQILATDLDDRALQIARAGSYPIGIQDEVSPQRLKRFFGKRANRYFVSKEIRDMVVFSQHNLISDPPYTRLDLISCRNLLIYLGSHLQKKLIPLFHYALKPRGYLLLGPSETMSNHKELFRPVDAKPHIYQRKSTAIRSLPAGEIPRLQVPSLASAADQPKEVDLFDFGQRIVLDEFAPQWAIVDDDGQIHALSADTSEFLKLAGGSFRNSVIHMAHSGLRIGLRTAFANAKKHRRRCTAENTSIRLSDGIQLVNVIVQPMPEVGEDSGLHLIVFQKVGQPIRRDHSKRDTDSSLSNDEHTSALIEQLERELASTREQLERAVQDLEVSNEELKSSNEELLSMNEELQSANEELETSKEELQASNETLASNNTDLNNLLRSTSIATIFLDNQYRIRSFTPAATAIYGLVTTDIGRPLDQLNPHVLAMPPLPTMQQLADAPQPPVDTLQTPDGRWFIRRVMPYETINRGWDGMVVTFTDVTEIRTAQLRLEMALEGGQFGAWELDLQTDRAWHSPTHDRIFGYDQPVEHWSGEKFLEHVVPEDRDRVRPAFDIDKLTRDDWAVECRIRRTDGEIRWIVARGRPVRDAVGNATRICGAVTDITDRVRDAELIANSEAQLRRIIDNMISFVGVLDADGTLLEANRMALEVAGISREEVVGKKFWDCHWWTHDAAVVEQLKTAVARARTGQPVRCDLEGRVADGKLITVDFMLAPVMDESGRVTHLIPSSTDITDRKQAEARIQELLAQAIESSAKLRVFFDQSLYFASVLNLQGTVIDINRTSLRQSGFSREQVIGKPFWEIGWWRVSPGIQRTIRYAVQQAAGGTAFRAELPYWHADGTERTADFAITPVRSDSGEIIYLVPSGQDISEKREAELAMRESEMRFRTLADNIAQFAWMAEADGKITWYNQRWLDYTGTTLEQMQAQGWSEVLHPDHAERVTKKLERAFKVGAEWEDTFPLRRHDGAYRWFLSRMIPIRDDNWNVVRWFGTNTDISKQKQIEQRLRRSSDQLRLGIEVAGFAVAEVHFDEQRVHLTEDFATMFGLDSDQLTIGLDVLHGLCHPDDRQDLETRISRALSEQKDQILSLDHRIVRENHEVRWMSIRAHFFFERDESGQVVARRSILAAQDVTSVKENQAELENARRLAEAANQSKSDFLANMSHEIRSPMTAILGFADLLKTDDEVEREKVETIRRNGQFLLELINDILDLSKIEAGKVEIDPVSFSPGQLLEDVCSLMSIRASESGLDMNLVYQGAIPVSIKSDPIRLRQVLINLVGNAIKFTDQGQVTLRLRYLESTRQLWFDVIDTGIGISMEQQHKLFQPFEQGDSSVVRKYGGSGLGLAISQRLAELLGGHIEVVSKPGDGSTFSLAITCDEVSETQTPTELDRHAWDDSGAGGNGQISRNLDSGLLNIRALIVDDRRDIRFLTQHLVRQLGGEVLTGENGLEALETVAAEQNAGRKIDIVLMDVQMPKMDGLTAVGKLRQQGFLQPVIALTANAMDSDREACLAAGYTDYLSKPINNQQLTEKLRQYCSG